ncbi:hypothetical protein AFK68_06260 [Hydrocoleum sp. CS-953]|uniref:DUF192 domain-containing protein n=1 Tax=Hydrocoleum sp. CS-953 TaxID=1671698 RepID=UPI000B9A5C3A|nr:DUF192 domain-containing protein [Hydrocoleum sp. CS-953]OZH55176.1 hypothetical protein AFK68_06260 [Hydrocoleum sp. CS-953]
MGSKFGLFKSGIILFLVGCLLQITFVIISQTTTIQAKAQQLSNFQVSQEAQVLPITAQAQISGQIINLEVAKTPKEQAMGLMYRTELPDDQGMLFSFDPPRKVNFWMKNCKISLDMIFIRSGVVKAIALDVPPCLADPCPLYGSGVPVDRVIEVRGGRIRELGLKVGERIIITKN